MNPLNKIKRMVVNVIGYGSCSTHFNVILCVCIYNVRVGACVCKYHLYSVRNRIVLFLDEMFKNLKYTVRTIVISTLVLICRIENDIVAKLCEKRIYQPVKYDLFFSYFYTIPTFV